MLDQRLPLIEVAGTAYDMGYQHGAQAAGLISRYLLWIEKLAGRSREKLCQQAVAFLPALKSLSPALVSEIEGLAHGAGLSFEEALLCQVRGEVGQTSEGGCTAFALTGSATANGRPMAGQNQDLEPEYAELTILLRVKPNDGRPGALMFTFAGQLGYTGMNEYGLAHFHNSLYNFRRRPGLPRQLLKRLLLEKRTVEKCLDFLEGQPLSSAGNLLLVDAGGRLADVELRPEGNALWEDEHPDFVAHANHYLTPRFAAYENNTIPDSPPRLARLRALVTENWGRVTVETLKTILADHDGDPGGICRHGATGWHSISGYIAEPAERLLHVRRGHGCLGSWHTYEV